MSGAEAFQAKLEKEARRRSVQAARDAARLPTSSDGPEITPDQDGAAQAFAAEFAGRLVYDHTGKEWRLWNGGRWQADECDRAFHNVRVFCRGLRATMRPAPSDVGKIAFAAAVERAARSDPRMAVSHRVWDADPWLLGVPDGVVDLRTGEVQDADPSLYISRQTAVAPGGEGAEHPVWSAFLDEATGGDRETQGFLQRLAGYFLTGDVSEEVLTFLYGPGGNGKGVFLGALTAIIGEYAVASPIDVFTAGSRLNLEYYRAQMAGARLVTASETEAGATWAESQIKELTGNEAPISGRQPHGRAFTFRPVFKLLLVGNHAPRLKGRTPAMERRLRVVPFNNEPARPDPDLKERLKAEYPAILRWMLDGCLSWQRERLGSATAIAAATSAYFEAQDGFRRWLEERCILDPALQIRPAALHGDFASWTRDNGDQPASAGEFREMVERTRGLRYAKVKGTLWIKGVGLKAPDNGFEE